MALCCSAMPTTPSRALFVRPIQELSLRLRGRARGGPGWGVALANQAGIRVRIEGPDRRVHAYVVEQFNGTLVQYVSNALSWPPWRLFKLREGRGGWDVTVPLDGIRGHRAARRVGGDRGPESKTAGRSTVSSAPRSSSASSAVAISSTTWKCWTGCCPAPARGSPSQQRRASSRTPDYRSAHATCCALTVSTRFTPRSRPPGPHRIRRARHGDPGGVAAARGAEARTSTCALLGGCATQPRLGDAVRDLAHHLSAF